MPSVNEYLNIRAAGDENAEVVGKLYKGDAAEIVEQGDTWTHVRSGSVDGYVLNAYCAFGMDAYELAKKDCQTEAKVMTGGLRLRMRLLSMRYTKVRCSLWILNPQVPMAG